MLLQIIAFAGIIQNMKHKSLVFSIYAIHNNPKIFMIRNTLASRYATCISFQNLTWLEDYFPVKHFKIPKNFKAAPKNCFTFPIILIRSQNLKIKTFQLLFLFFTPIMTEAIRLFNSNSEEF